MGSRRCFAPGPLRNRGSLRRVSNAFWAPPFVSARFCNYGAEKFRRSVAPNVRKAVPKCVPPRLRSVIRLASRGNNAVGRGLRPSRNLSLFARQLPVLQLRRGEFVQTIPNGESHVFDTQSLFVLVQFQRENDSGIPAACLRALFPGWRSRHLSSRLALSLTRKCDLGKSARRSVSGESSKTRTG